MLKTRVIPTILWKDVGIVKGIAFDSWRRVGSILPAIRVYNTRQVDELIVVDITASAAGREPDYASVEEFSKECFVPMTVGGGVRTVEHVKQLLRAGADKVSINSAAYADEGLIPAAAKLFGTQCIIASIDYRMGPDGRPTCYSHSGTRATGLEVVPWARKVEALGAGEILLTSIERDGTMKGYDLPLIRAVASAVSIPVIASGGAGGYDDLRRAIQEGGASAVAAASIFHFTELTPLGGKDHLSKHGVPVRR